MRGEHPEILAVPPLEAGSAPRARGTLDRTRFVSSARRISPACAGNTPNVIALICRFADQPRVRGEHFENVKGQQTATGSAPRARGTPASCSSAWLPLRISPACAGNTLIFDPPFDLSPDQPRVRGEHIAFLLSATYVVGSAPRARGTAPRTGSADQPRVRGDTYNRAVETDDQPRVRHVVNLGMSRRRISPACAGNTLARHKVELSGSAPRRGTHRRSPCNGSAPRARGTRPAASKRSTDQRVRGEHERRAVTDDVSDQPRVRGEHASTFAHRQNSSGSAPRARGTQCNVRIGVFKFRISPACAGNTPARGRGTSPQTDQPRVRGEHERFTSCSCAVDGSAPRARGTRMLDTGTGCPFADQPRVRGEHPSARRS